jgi:UDPglucose--hexose-1-phosphate uridylyltransferase
VQVFENKGAMMGCSNPHPHGQIWATSAIPLVPARKLETQRAWFERHGSDLVGDYLAEELRSGERVVCRNESWVALVPYWAVWPFELMLVPTRRVADLPSLDARGRFRRPAAPRVRALRQPVRVSFPYSMGFPGGRRTAGIPGGGCAVYFPPLPRRECAEFLVGFELRRAWRPHPEHAHGGGPRAKPTAPSGLTP